MFFPHFPQIEAMDCGPASLRMIAEYYDKSYTMQTLREYCFITREGVSMQGINYCSSYKYILGELLPYIYKYKYETTNKE